MRMTFHGQKELEEALRQLPKELTGKAGGPVKLALKAAAQPILEAQQMQAMIHSDTGDLLEDLEETSKDESLANSWRSTHLEVTMESMFDECILIVQYNRIFCSWHCIFLRGSD